MSDTTIDDIYSPLIMNNDTCMECGVNFKEAKSALYDLILKEVVGANRHDIVEVEGTDITDYMNMHRSLQRNKLKELFDE